MEETGHCLCIYALAVLPFSIHMYKVNTCILLYTVCGHSEHNFIIVDVQSYAARGHNMLGTCRWRVLSGVCVRAAMYCS